jgi:hypothetical protein
MERRRRGTKYLVINRLCRPFGPRWLSCPYPALTRGATSLPALRASHRLSQPLDSLSRPGLSCTGPLRASRVENRPTHCRKDYRMVVVRKDLAIEMVHVVGPEG